MALPKNFPASPHAILDPAIRWLPASAHNTSTDKLLPPLVDKLRRCSTILLVSLIVSIY